MACTRFIIKRNDFLFRDTVAYFHQYYTGYGEPNNPNFLNTLKNTFNREPIEALIEARNKVIDILVSDIPEIIRGREDENWIMVCVPRAKALDTYNKQTQLMFQEAVSIAAQNIKGVIDGTGYIRRIKNTRTTHIRSPKIPNDGPDPYPGITIATCQINRDKIKGKKIILVDDVYTQNVNVDEDCIQALYDCGADEIIFYAIGYTRRNL
ncbi:amidophosphoribosyltransferase [Thermosyntropha lipolytica]|uniref:amidophosphoribosyltransferase n=1 Tax=Thermosyntropha lipolytica TaxID=54294 RepID=UPI0011606874|nr:amidophosphoribosyltransferase [Thermosyntropha lipolytica]